MPTKKRISAGPSTAFLYSRGPLFAIVGVLLIVFFTVTIMSGLGKHAKNLNLGFTQNVSAAAPLRISFPEAMDHASVEKSLTLPSGVEGNMSWDGNTLVFQPSTKLDAGEAYEFVIAKSAMKTDGTSLQQNYVFRFIVTGVPTLSAHTPATNATGVDTSSHITLVFDQPMVALTQVQGAPADALRSSWPVTISPNLRGQWRWISTYAVQFIPESGLVAGTLYTVTVPAGIPTASGEKTDKDGSWKFETVRPMVMSSDPEEHDLYSGPTTQFTLTMNLDMNPDSVAKHVKLYRVERKTGTGAAKNSSGTELAVKAVKFGTSVIDGKKITDRHKITIIPAEKLALNTDYLVVLTPGTLAAQGNLGTDAEYVLHVHTVGPLEVRNAQYQYGTVNLYFSSPVPEDTDLTFFTIKPTPKDWKNASVSTDMWGDSRTVSINVTSLEPSTEYTFTVSKKFADKFGQHLAEPYSFTFTTPDLMPEVSLGNTKGDFGIFERDKPPVYYINAVNVKTINVEFAKLSLEDFINFRSEKIRSWSFKPDLTGKANYQTWELTRTQKKNLWQNFAFDVRKKTGTTLKPGLYAMKIQSPQYTDGNGVPIVLEQYFAVTNTALTLKFSGDRALVWATDLTTGQPVKNASIVLHSLQNQTPVSGKTDAQGLFDAPITIADFTNQTYEWIPEFWVTAERGDDFAFVSSQWNGGFSPGEFSLMNDFHSAGSMPYRLMQEFITDRPAYRPGDTVSFKGIVRLKDWNGHLQLPGGSRQMQVAITNPSGTEVYNKTLPFTEFGGFYGSFTSPENAELGSYSVTLHIIPDNDGGMAYTQGFQILAYRKPEYKVELTPRAEDYFAGDAIDVDLAGSYYFGAPLSNAAVTWRAETADYFFNKYTDGWYSFSTADYWCWWGCMTNSSQLTEGRGTLDATGHMRIRFPFPMDDKKVSQIATIEADVSDPNNQIVSNRVSVPVHKSGVYVGIRNQDYSVVPGENARVGIVTVDFNGKPVSNASVSISLSSRVWNSIKKKGVDGEYYYENEPVDTFVSSSSVTTGADGKATADVLLPSGGEFIITAEVSDEKGRMAKAGTSVYAWSDTYINWPHNNNDRIDIVADKPEYAVGDTAKLLVKSPFQGEGVKALVTVERENVITKKVIDVKGNALPIDVPITEDYVPNVYASVVIIKPRVGETFDDQGKDTGVPSFRVGYVQLHVETKRKKLSVSVATDKKQYLPGEKVTATITAKDADGKPVEAEFSLAAADMSVLALAGFTMPDLVANFYADHGLGVFTSQMLTYLIERYKPGSKGGGGGLEERTRDTFQDTAYWNPIVVTDKNGKATMTFKLPDNLTTWQLFAAGGTKDSRFGAATKEVISTKNVIVRQVRPRFAVRGDKISLGAIVHNFLPQTKTFTVTVSGSGFTIPGKAMQSITVKPGAQERVLFPVVANAVSSMTISMEAKTEGARDEVVEKIPVYIFGTPQSVATTGETTSMVTEKVLAPSTEDASDGKLTMTVSPSLATYLPGGLEYVAQYPYGCAEQTASAFLPQLALKRLQGFDAFKIVPDATLDKNIGVAIQKLYTFQRADGGFGYWELSSQSNPELSAFILYTLKLAQDSGYSVDGNVLKRARDYLDAILRANAKLQTSEMLATRAYIIFVLAETGKPDSNLISNLYTNRKLLPVFAQAELAMALQRANMHGKASEVLQSMLDNAKIDPRGAHVEEPHVRAYRMLMQTNTRTTAEALQAMIRIDPGNKLIPQFIRFLLAARIDGHWDTTQSTTQTVLALTEYLKLTGELSGDFTAGIDVNGKMVATQHFGKSNILSRTEVVLALNDLQRGEENTVKIGMDADGKGTMFYDILLSYFFTGDTIAPIDEGMSILRELGSVDPAVKSVNAVKAGETYKVTLTMTVPEDRYMVAVESPLPGGLEAIDPGLQTSQQTGDPALLEKKQSPFWWWDEEENNGLWRFSHREFRDDRVFLFADYLPAGVYKYTYLVRATTPGTFRQRPAHIFEMYFPETFGQTSGEWFTVKE